MGWLSGFNKRIKLTLDASDVTSALANFPILVYLSTSSGITDADVSAVFDELGVEDLKIAITTSDGVTQQYVEVVSWDNANEVAELWTKVETISSSSDTILYLYYDKYASDNSTYVGVTGSTVAENVWDSNFKLVCRMNDNPDTSSVMDSTSNDNDGTKKAANEPIETDGKIGKAQDFDAVNDQIVKLSPSNLPSGDVAKSMAAWFKSNDLSGDCNLGGFGNNAVGENFQVGLQAATGDWHVWGCASDWWTGIDKAPYEDNNWHQMVVTYDGTTTKLYFDKIEVATTTIYNWATNPQKIVIGNEIDEAGHEFNGIIDEFQIYSDTWSSAWVGASYETQRDHFITYGSQELSSELSMIIGETWLLGK